MWECVLALVSTPIGLLGSNSDLHGKHYPLRPMTGPENFFNIYF